MDYFVARKRLINVSLAKSSFTVNDSTATSLPPVLCQVMFVKARSYDQKFTLSLGAVFDSYATDNYITHKHANKLGLVSYSHYIYRLTVMFVLILV